jgi:hypothetical protein
MVQAGKEGSLGFLTSYSLTSRPKIVAWNHSTKTRIHCKVFEVVDTKSCKSSQTTHFKIPSQQSFIWKAYAPKHSQKFWFSLIFDIDKLSNSFGLQKVGCYQGVPPCHLYTVPSRFLSFCKGNTYRDDRTTDKWTPLKVLIYEVN